MADSSASDDAVVIERSFDAPPELVWRMWTEPDHLRAWYGPGGASLPVVQMDVRVGGTRLVCMAVETPAGPRQMWFTGQYVEVVTHQRLAYTESMSDEHGNVLSAEEAGLPPGHPATTQVTVTLEDVAGHTRMVLTHVGVPADSPGAAGWLMAFEKLAAHLETQRVV
jgi:uncharacterized protein YndB with AHSA1/START domain